MKLKQDRYGVFWYNQQQILNWTQADFDNKAAEFASAGINIVMTFSSTHFRWSFYPWWKEINATVAKIVNACHKYNIRVVEHHSSHLTHNPRSQKEWKAFYNTLRTRQSTIEMFPGLKEYIACGDPEILPGVNLSDCRQIDGRTGDFARTVYTGYGHCFNNPDYRKVYFSYLEDLYATGIDGIMTDDVQYFGYHNACACKYCREKFKTETGFDLPLPADWGKFHGNFDNPVFIEWLRFRVRSTEQFQRDVNAHFKSLGLNLLRPNYATTTFNCNTVAYPFEAAGDLWSCVFQENMFSSVIRTAWPTWYNIAEHRFSMGRRYKVPSMSMFYPARFDDYYFCWSLAKACNHLLMASPEGGDINEVEEKFAPFDENNPILENASDLPDIGFFEPRSSLDLSPEPLKNAIWPMNVWLQGALFRNLRNAILFEDDSLEEFLKYPLVVLCGANMLSDEHLELLKKYCQQGGRLFVCGTFGIYRPDGSRREHPEKVFGIKAQLSDFVPTPQSKFTWKNQTVELSPQEESRIFEKICGETEIVAETNDGKTIGISAMNGNFVWLAGGIGGRKPEDHFYDLRISRWLEVPGRANAQKNPEESLHNISGAILELLTERKPHIACSSRDYLATIFLSSDRKSGEIHLVNTSKVLPESGESVSHDDLFTNFMPDAAKNRQDIAVTLCIPHKITGAKAFSPEFDNVPDLKFSQNGDTVSISIPAETFAGYLKIKIELKKI
ncbi:MAG: hypothetical protein E7044_15015 [Lentisphaerae bacterium]|nr:hypothetical protein [Lentisphaerota bacterium]